jgi:phasin family protein
MRPSLRTGRIGLFETMRDEAIIMAKIPTSGSRSGKPKAQPAIAKKAGASASAVSAPPPRSRGTSPQPVTAAATPAGPKPRTPARAATRPSAPAPQKPSAKAGTAKAPAVAIARRPSDEVPSLPVQASAPAALAQASAAAFAAPLRSVADTSLNQARETYATLREGADKLTSGLDASTQAAAKGVHDFGTTLLGAMQTNADALFGFVKAITSVRTVSEAIELQARVAREQFETVRSQGRQLAGIVNRTATETAAPLRSALDRPAKPSS